MARWRVGRVEGEALAWAMDTLVAEEPLEIRLRWGEGARFARVAVTMRTPGHDFDLAAGFLFTEGILDGPHQVWRLTYCADPTVDGAQRYNIVNVWVQDAGVCERLAAGSRDFRVSSSCGLCGKSSIESVRLQPAYRAGPRVPRLDPWVIGQLPGELRRAQRLFDRTGGLHAAGLFDASGHLVAVREDVGRHNAVDKVVGSAFLSGGLPLSQHILVVSGRAGFEIVQKAAMAGIPAVVSVSAPTSLACEAAREWGLTLIGFARGERFNVYTGAERLCVRAGAYPAMQEREAAAPNG
ncbi:MAG: formate dehydrogenase accessory sulfurtransferase FdhD [Limnochordaceae bacterium]|nr:formate dehydrogenase accessory sulfurtransferase FdhD [Limnochordaceae bacterium]